MDLLIACAIGLVGGIAAGFVLGFLVAATMALNDLKALKETLKDRNSIDNPTHRVPEGSWRQGGRT